MQPKNRSDELAQRRLALQARSAAQREQIAAIGNELESRLSSADRIISIASAVIRNPLVSVAAIGATLTLGPWRIVRWFSQGAFLLGAAKRVYSLVRNRA